jgi:hypothetical protein
MSAASAGKPEYQIPHIDEVLVRIQGLARRGILFYTCFWKILVFSAHLLVIV